MLEIIAIIFLGKKISEIVKAKGHNPTGYVILMVVLWIGLELTGAVIGALLIGDGPALYIFAIIGGIMGAAIAYAIADNVKPAAVKGVEQHS